MTALCALAGATAAFAAFVGFWVALILVSFA